MSRSGNVQRNGKPFFPQVCHRLGNMPWVLVKLDARNIQNPDRALSGVLSNILLPPWTHSKPVTQAVRNYCRLSRQLADTICNHRTRMFGQEDNAFGFAKRCRLPCPEDMHFQGMRGKARAADFGLIKRQQVSKHGYVRPKLGGIVSTRHKKQVARTARLLFEHNRLPIQTKRKAFIEHWLMHQLEPAARRKLLERLRSAPNNHLVDSVLKWFCLLQNFNKMRDSAAYPEIGGVNANLHCPCSLPLSSIQYFFKYFIFCSLFSAIRYFAPFGRPSFSGFRNTARMLLRSPRSRSLLLTILSYSTPTLKSSSDRSR